MKDLEATVASKDTEVAQLETENASLRSQVENQQALLIRKEEERSVLRSENTTLMEELARVKAQLEAAAKKADEVSNTCLQDEPFLPTAMLLLPSVQKLEVQSDT